VRDTVSYRILAVYRVGERPAADAEVDG